MGEIEDYVILYIENSDILEDKLVEISKDLEQNIQDEIAPGKVGYDTGHLHDNIISDYDNNGKFGVVMAWYGADYGQYWYRWKGGIDFMKSGLDKTIQNYR